MEQILKILNVSRLPENTCTLINENISIFEKIINGETISDDITNGNLCRVIGIIYAKKKEQLNAKKYIEKAQNYLGDEMYCYDTIYNDYFFNYYYPTTKIKNEKMTFLMTVLYYCQLLNDYSGVDEVVEQVVKIDDNNSKYYNESNPEESILFHYYYTIYYNKSNLFYELERYSEFMHNIFNVMDEKCAQKHHSKLVTIISHYNYLIQQKLSKNINFSKSLSDVIFN